VIDGGPSLRTDCPLAPDDPDEGATALVEHPACRHRASLSLRPHPPFAAPTSAVNDPAKALPFDNGTEQAYGRRTCSL
jgi:hypothetical protein